MKLTDMPDGYTILLAFSIIYFELSKNVSAWTFLFVTSYPLHGIKSIKLTATSK